MTTAFHTDIAFGASATPATINDPLGQLDAAIVAVETALSGTALPVTTTDATASAGQMVVPVTATTGFVAGQSIWLGDIGGTFETRIINTIQAGVSLTVTANLTYTYAAGKVVSASPSELVEARDGKTTLHTRIRSAGGTSGAAFPGSPVTNDVCVRTDRGGSRYVYGGAAWTQADVPSVTSFWGSPSTNDRCYRSDRAIEYEYNGTRWLSTTEYSLPLAHGPDVTDSVTVQTGTLLIALAPWATLYDLWLISFDVMGLVLTTNNGTNYWTLTLEKWANATASTAAAYDTSGLTANAWGFGRMAIGALLGTTNQWLRVRANPVLAPGGLSVRAALRYRLVG